MVGSLHDWWWGQAFLSKFFKGNHQPGAWDKLCAAQDFKDHSSSSCGLYPNHLSDACMPDDSSNQNSKTLRDAKTPKEGWWVLSKWSGGLENKCVGGWVITIFCWRWSSDGLGIWTWLVSKLPVHVQRQHLCIGQTTELGLLQPEHKHPVACQTLPSCRSASDQLQHTTTFCWSAIHGKGALGHASETYPCQHTWSCTCCKQSELLPELH